MDTLERAALSLPFGPDDEVSAPERSRLLGRYGRHIVAGETLFQEGTGAARGVLASRKTSWRADPLARAKCSEDGVQNRQA
jgi:hypothetical protein